MSTTWISKFLARLRSRPAAINSSRKQPTPIITGEDVKRVVDREFPYEFTTVMTLLEECGVDSFRVQLACLKLAGGEIEKLRKLTDAARVDYRDVLAHAEYPEYFRVGWRMDMTEDERQQIRERDWKQYEIWLKK